MPEIIDNLYLFSTSRKYYGEIIASRVGVACQNCDIFSQIVLMDGEDDFLSSELERNDNKLVVVMGRCNEKSVPIIFLCGFCGVAGLGLVIEMLEPDPVMLRCAIAGFSGGVSVSDSVREMIEASFNKRFPSGSDYLDSIAAADKLREYAGFGEFSLYDAILEIAHLVVVRIEMSSSQDTDVRLGVAMESFAGKELLAMLSIMAFLAREFGKDRSLSVKIKRYSDGITVSSSLITECKDLDGIKHYISDIAEGVGMICSVATVGEALKCDVVPYVHDVALVGGKAPGGMAVQLFYFDE